MDPDNVPRIIYPGWGFSSNSIIYPANLVDEANFNMIPGLGRALKFTFTLYDSKGIFENGKTFTHIVYLNN